jgi:hypothetical protein
VKQWDNASTREPHKCWTDYLRIFLIFYFTWEFFQYFFYFSYGSIFTRIEISIFLWKNFFACLSFILEKERCESHVLRSLIFCAPLR